MKLTKISEGPMEPHVVDSQFEALVGAVGVVRECGDVHDEANWKHRQSRAQYLKISYN